MTLNCNCDYCCHDIQFSQELLSKCKKATALSLGINMTRVILISQNIQTSRVMLIPQNIKTSRVMHFINFLFTTPFSLLQSSVHHLYFIPASVTGNQSSQLLTLIIFYTMTIVALSVCGQKGVVFSPDLFLEKLAITLLLLCCVFHSYINHYNDSILILLF